MCQNDVRNLKLKRLKFPKFELRKGSKIELAELNFKNMDRLSKDNWPVGFELEMYEKYGSLLRLENREDDCLRSLGIQYIDRSYAKFANRPYSELAAWYIWNAHENGRIGIEEIRQLNRIVGGGNTLRKGLLTTTKFRSGHVTQFDCTDEPLIFLELWIKEFYAPVCPNTIMTRAYWLFLNFLVAHPFCDGNGRTARIMLQAYLHINKILAAPILPLGPFLHINQRAFLNAALSWEVLHRPLIFFEFMDKAIISTKLVANKLVMTK